MANNDNIINVLRRCFNPPFDEEDERYDSRCPFTNCALVFAYNGTGKTRLSYDFAHYGRKDGDPQHTLYYNAYTEDLFTWNNDLDNNTEHRLLINQDSTLIQGLSGSEFSDKLRPYLHMFTDIDFDFHYKDNNVKYPEYVTFSKTVKQRIHLNGQWTDIPVEIENIKISRGEERLFVWCFFRCILDEVIGGNDAYKDIEYIYIDDPMSSLDDNNVIVFAEQLHKVIGQQLKQEIKEKNDGRENFRRIKFVVSSHHALFFHVMVHGLKADRKLKRYYLNRNKQNDQVVLKQMSDDTPFYYNVAVMSELQRAIDEDKLYTYHFNVLRSVMDKIKEFFGHHDYKDILDGITFRGKKFVAAKTENESKNEEIADLYSRIVNVFSHQASFFSPSIMNNDNKENLITIFNHLKDKYKFNLPNLNDYHNEAWIARQRDE